jgi:hypothetical protein
VVSRSIEQALSWPTVHWPETLFIVIKVILLASIAGLGGPGTQRSYAACLLGFRVSHRLDADTMGDFSFSDRGSAALAVAHRSDRAPLPQVSKHDDHTPSPLMTMLRIHFLQQWSSLCDPAMEETLIEVATMRFFVGIELISERIPDYTPILIFPYLLQNQGLVELIFDTVRKPLSTWGVSISP